MEEDILNYLTTVMFRGTLCIKDNLQNRGKEKNRNT